MTKENIALVIALIALVLGGWNVSEKMSFGAATAPTGMLIEQYVPVVQYNGGIKTALPISILATGTTTEFKKSSSSTQGWCTEFNATSTNTVLNLTFTASSTAPTNGSGVIATVNYGVCN